MWQDREWELPEFPWKCGRAAVKVRGLRLAGDPCHGNGSIAYDLPAKLRLTAALLSCGTGKELALRFRAVNPSTAFDVERARKWLQGRALPRNAQVYEDWTKLLRLDKTGTWLAVSSIETFVAEVAVRWDADPDELLRRASRASGSSESSAATSQLGTSHVLIGDYAVYSHSWSPYHAGMLIRGAMSISTAGGSSLVAVYSETFTGQPVRWSGPVQAARGALLLDLREAGSDLPLFVSVFQPRPPACAFVGTMSGVAFIGPEARPSTTRIAFVRVPKASAQAAERSNRYLVPNAEEIDADLAALGLLSAVEVGAGSTMAEFLTRAHLGTFDQVTAAEQTAIAELFDGPHVASFRPANPAAAR